MAEVEHDPRQPNPLPRASPITFVVGGETFMVIADESPTAEAGWNDQIAATLSVGGRHYVIVSVPSKPASDEDAVSQLTRRELEIALLVAAGKVTKEIAQQLRLSIWTVSTYLRRSFAKLHVTNRAELAARIAASLERHHRET